MKRARIIYNPTSGREAIKREMLDILSVYEKAGYETSAFATTPEPMSAAKEAKRAAEEGFDSDDMNMVNVVSEESFSVD